jgi:hypothetical protein
MTEPQRTSLADGLAGRYLLEAEIGRGAAAIVYLAQATVAGSRSRR